MTFASPLILAITLFGTASESPAPVGRSDGSAEAGFSERQECTDWQSCRQQAIEAKDRKDYDAFHDLAWRALQKGPKNNPELMLLVARAQSLSGRPHDALVMLQRLTAMGAPTDAATSEDFERVRVLPAWAELEAKVAGKPAMAAPAPKPEAPPTPETTSKPNARAKKEAAAKPEAPAKPEPAPKTEPTPKTEPPPKTEPAPKTETATATPTRTKASAADPLTFASAGITAAGLAYDAVSGRFLIGDKQEHRLLVVGERSGRPASLAGSDGGVGEITAFEIDAQEGDLWVVSASSAAQATTIRKLQLISGRVLTSIALPAQHGSARFGDVGVTPQSILVLDTEGRRLFRVAKKGKTVDLVARLAASVTSLAPASDGSAYAAYDQGLLHIDLSTRALTVVEPGADTDVSGLTWIRWHRGSIVAMQRVGSDAYRLVRIRLDSGGRAIRGVDLLADDLRLAGVTSATISGNTVYYLATSSGSNDIVVSKQVLKP
jgi:hypothetical protein